MQWKTVKICCAINACLTAQMQAQPDSTNIFSQEKKDNIHRSQLLVWNSTQCSVGLSPDMNQLAKWVFAQAWDMTFVFEENFCYGLLCIKNTCQGCLGEPFWHFVGNVRLQTKTKSHSCPLLAECTLRSRRTNIAVCCRFMLQQRHQLNEQICLSQPLSNQLQR